MNLKITIDPRNKMSFSSYYIEGLRALFGNAALRFSLSPFTELNRSRDFSYDHYMCFVTNRGGQERRYIIDFHDSTSISEEAYRWCDVYAKINISKETRMEDWPKLMSIPPGFGVRSKGLVGTLMDGVENLGRMRFHSLNGLYCQLYDTYVLTLRRPLSMYEKKYTPQAGYIFHASTLWPHDNCMQLTNPYRATFIRTCRSLPGIQFEGGLVKTHGDIPADYADVTTDKRYTLDEYFENTMRSMFVFNTPAVHQCHGWKLGEYFAMGKAIVSTPISNRLPFPFEDGKHLLVVRDHEELVDAINRLSKDKELRHELEASSRNIYEQYSSPVAVMRNVVRKIS